MFSLKKMVNDNIYRKNRLILPRAVIPVRGVDQEEHEFLFFADQSGMQHNERINKSLTNNNTIYTEMALKTSIDTNNTKKALNLMTNIATWTFVDLAFIYRACLKKRHEKTGRNTQKYSFTRTKSASQCLSSSPLPQRKEPNQKIKKFLTWPWTAVIQRILW